MARIERLIKISLYQCVFNFLDETPNSLFGVLTTGNAALLNSLGKHPLMKKWWLNMKDMVESPDNSPVGIPLKEVFYLL